MRRSARAVVQVVRDRDREVRALHCDDAKCNSTNDKKHAKKKTSQIWVKRLLLPAKAHSRSSLTLPPRHRATRRTMFPGLEQTKRTDPFPNVGRLASIFGVLTTNIAVANDDLLYVSPETSPTCGRVFVGKNLIAKLPRGDPAVWRECLIAVVEAHLCAFVRAKRSRNSTEVSAPAPVAFRERWRRALRSIRVLLSAA